MIALVIEAFLAGVAKELYSRPRKWRPCRDVKAAGRVFYAYRDGIDLSGR